MATFLTIPPELRLHVYSFLPALHPNTNTTIAISKKRCSLTPAISRSHPLIRQETLPLYARHSHFQIGLDDESSTQALEIWLGALSCPSLILSPSPSINGRHGAKTGDGALSEIRTLQLSQHWKLYQPSRWQGHVGFYLRLERCGGDAVEKSTAGGEASALLGCAKRKASGEGDGWKCTSGTYPMVRDRRGMRSECLKVLEDVVMRVMGLAAKRKGGGLGLESGDVWLIVKSMDVVASHPIPTYDIEQRQSGVFEKMKGKLVSLVYEGKGGEEAAEQSFTPC